MDLLESTLKTISDPESKFYGKWLSQQEVDEMTLCPERIARVTKYFEDKGFKTVRKDAFIECYGPIKLVEEVFNTELFNFKSAAAQMTIARTTKFTIPDELEA